VPHSFRRSSLLAALALLAALVPLARPAFAATITVTSFADSGPGTLRQAIIDANASVGPDTITFSVPGTITLATALPALTGGSITITALSRPPAACRRSRLRVGASKARAF